MNFKFLYFTIIGLSFALCTQANAGLITKDYSKVGDGHITYETIGNTEWLDVSLFVGMNLTTLLGVNQWTLDGFHLASDVELVELYKNAGITYIRDYDGKLHYGTSDTAASVLALDDLYTKMGGDPDNFDGSGSIKGIQKDDNNDGNAKAASFNKVWNPFSSWANARVNTTCDCLGKSFTSRSDVGAFFVRSVDVPEPSTLAIFALGMMGLASRRMKKS